MNRARTGHQAGFTLIEVMIAFALLALALTLLLGSLSGAARQVRHADYTSNAALHAQSLLAQVGVVEPLRPGRREGVFGAGTYQWQLDVSPYVDPLLPARPPQPQAPRLLQLDLLVWWGEGPAERLRWRTLRLALPAPESAAIR